jgi:pyridoxamine 5'-phosphate oxidase
MPEPPLIADLRQEYRAHALRESDLAADPIAQFRAWLDDAVAAGHPEPNAMALATVDAQGAPSARTVLLKGLDERGFGFYTNTQSRKAAELGADPRAALVFHWVTLSRQVRVVGSVSVLSDEESDAYFATRPRGAQLGAWASQQSRVAASRTAIEDAMKAASERFGDAPVPRPPHWGGYVLAPRDMEFWQGRPDRLHDRLRYRRTDGGNWTVERLWP